MTDFKISFCTVCMNRLNHLKQTLKQNIFDNLNYQNVEFILLDYNSIDGLDDYIYQNFQPYIKSDKLKFYRTVQPSYFNRSHSRNVAFKLATGDLICNIDADNYTGKNFASYLNYHFKNSNHLFLSALVNRHKSDSDVLGRISLKRNDFYSVGGYDEQMTSYGYEDYDLNNRLSLNGLTGKGIEKKYLKALFHKVNERISNEIIFKSLKGIFLSYISPSCTKFLILLNDFRYIAGSIINNHTYRDWINLSDISKTQLKYTYSIIKDNNSEGKWSSINDAYILENENYKALLKFKKKAKRWETNLFGSSLDYYQIHDADLIVKIIMTYSQITNRIVMDANLLQKTVMVNNNIFGKEVVFKNFNYNQSILT